MSEIKTPLIELEKNELHTAGEQDFVITDKHSFADIIRFLISQGCDKQEAIALYDMEE